jgi:hypothetical protein
MSESNDGASATDPSLQLSNEEVVCPRCGYNLHGLAKSRCPECGLSYDPSSILESSAAAINARIFEYRWRERPVTSLVGTLLGSMRPARFWASIHPGLPVRIRPLIAYFLLTYVGLTFLSALAIAFRHYSNHVHFFYWKYLTGQGKVRFLKDTNPHVWCVEKVWVPFRSHLFGSAAAFPFLIFCMLAAITAMTFITRLRHPGLLTPRLTTVRVTIYAAGAGVTCWKLLTAISAVVYAVSRISFSRSWYQSIWWLNSDKAAMWMLGTAAFVFAWSIVSALRFHVRLHRPWITGAWILTGTGTMILAAWVVARAWLGWRLWPQGERILAPLASWIFGL